MASSLRARSLLEKGIGMCGSGKSRSTTTLERLSSHWESIVEQCRRHAVTIQLTSSLQKRYFAPSNAGVPAAVGYLQAMSIME